MQVGADIGAVEADARKLKQIVYNLLSNAVKFTAAKGQVTLRASVVPRSEVGRSESTAPERGFPLADSEFKRFLMISVDDTGIGIPRDALLQLFKPFTQVDTGLGRKFEGTGLGLVMVKLLAELHGGTVSIQSVVGTGSRFTVWIPLRSLDDRSPRITETSVVQATAPGIRTALVVEDDAKSAELIRLQLEAEGFAVRHAETAEAALAIAAQQPLALITLNVMMPQVDGWEFLARLKQIPDLKRIPVVIISILADRSKGFALGAAAVMQKPISRLELFESLEELGLSTKGESQTLTVLVVDDDREAVDLIATRLSGVATTILRAYGGAEAIEIACRDRPDLIILDLMMPDVTGFDVVESLNTFPETTSIPIIVVTSKDITAKDRSRLNGYVATIMGKTAFDTERFTLEVRRATSTRAVPV
jgi:CheY-like chemotaxis protein